MNSASICAHFRSYSAFLWLSRLWAAASCFFAASLITVFESGLVIDMGFPIYQQITVGILPGSITDLHFGVNEHKPLAPGILPRFLKRLVFAPTFTNGNEPLSLDVLPMSLTELNLGHTFNQAVEFPPLLARLRLSDVWNQELAVNSLPSTLTHLTFGDQFNNGGRPLAPGVIPPSVTFLIFVYAGSNNPNPTCTGNYSVVSC